MGRASIFIGIDDTDLIDTPGTNQLARWIVKELVDEFRCLRITRHQLLDDPRVPCTSQNGSASILLAPKGSKDGDIDIVSTKELNRLTDRIREMMQQWYVIGSDPGLCVTDHVPEEVIAFGWQAKRELIELSEAEQLAITHRIHLESLGGTRGGMIGALAAIGLAASTNDGRIIQWGEDPADRGGVETVETINSWSVDVVEEVTGEDIKTGLVNIGKKLRPNIRHGRAVLLVERFNSSDSGVTPVDWTALKRR